jgi:hypothetical protein
VTSQSFFMRAVVIVLIVSTISGASLTVSASSVFTEERESVNIVTLFGGFWATISRALLVATSSAVKMDARCGTPKLVATFHFGMTIPIRNYL